MTQENIEQFEDRSLLIVDDDEISVRVGVFLGVNVGENSHRFVQNQFFEFVEYLGKRTRVNFVTNFKST